MPPRKYATAEERRQAEKARARERYAKNKEAIIAYQKDWNKRLRKGNEWMRNLPTYHEIRAEWRRCEKEPEPEMAESVTIPTIDL